MAKILMVGGSGMVGALAVPQLLMAGHSVDLLVRKPVATRPEQKQHVAPVERWAEIIASLTPDIFISTLGTTLRDAGSKTGFAAVDKQLLLHCADAARSAGAQQAISISSVGADRRSGNFYLRTKGEVEEALRAIGFARLDLLRPGLLLGKRGGSLRLGERIAMAVAPVTNLLTPPGWDKYRAIPAASVASAIRVLAGADRPGSYTHQYREMRRLMVSD